jgi:hypothetical protein
MKLRLVRPLPALAAAAAIVATLAPLAVADAIYHTEHLSLTPVGGAPLRSGFVQNIKANGPVVYAHELFVLNGAAPHTTYFVTRNFYVSEPQCHEVQGKFVFHTPVGRIDTNAAGNGRDDLVVHPEELEGLTGDQGVFWTVADASGTVRYTTTCTTVTLD